MEKRISLLLVKLSNFLNKFFETKELSPYGEIKNPYENVNNTYGNGWSYCDVKIIEDFSPINMNDFYAKDHCTIASLTSIFRFHNIKNNNPSSNKDYELFNNIYAFAKENGYYESSLGTYPWRMAKIANEFIKANGKKGYSRNHFLFFNERKILSLLKKEINSNRPGIINFAQGSYKDHSVTFYGYVEFIRDDERKMYLLVNNNWNKDRVFVDLSKIGSVNTPFSITTVKMS